MEILAKKELLKLHDLYQRELGMKSDDAGRMVVAHLLSDAVESIDETVCVLNCLESTVQKLKELLT